ncbi:hypothetical protein [Desulfopila inferna]|uniref:hypothetical protein n=1 Tax=Desulfopila inferna TaxID=468528 RepID=UPI001964AEBF|nr:hypothetical protein [Desulfopila inferna]MBM9606041.1 hypothetical protein [Desulfopila inferna]
MVSWILTILRAIIGLLIIKTGLDLLLGNITFSGYYRETSLTGIFFILLGVHIVFAAFSILLREREQHKNRKSSSP